MLRLTIASSQRRKLGAAATRLFSEAGGTVGRSARCDWMLPDERHLLSNQHARIVHDGRGYTIIDTSTNGVFLNGRDIPLGRNQSAVIRDGDRLYLADYVIDVAVIEAAVIDRGADHPVPVALPGGEAGAFWEALGVPPSSLPADARDRLMRGLGTAMREALAFLPAAPPPAPPAAGDRLPQEVVPHPELTPDVARELDRTIRAQVVRDHAPEPGEERTP